MSLCGFIQNFDFVIFWFYGIHPDSTHVVIDFQIDHWTYSKVHLWQTFPRSCILHTSMVRHDISSCAHILWTISHLFKIVSIICSNMYRTVGQYIKWNKSGPGNPISHVLNFMRVLCKVHRGWNYKFSWMWRLKLISKK